MNNDTVRLIGQGLIIALVVSLLLVPALLLTSGISENRAERDRIFALRSILGEQRVTGEFPGDGPPVIMRYELDDGGTVTDLATRSPMAELRLLVRLDRRGEYVSHRVVYLNNSVNGWDFGNAFAARELTRPWTGDGQPDDPATLIALRNAWQRQIAGLIRTAREFR
jgi:hypothetical protein